MIEKEANIKSTGAIRRANARDSANLFARRVKREQMSVFEIIARRRSIGKMTAERPTRAQIERMLEAATHAPNHHHVQPWKFVVLAGSARAELGEVMAEALLARASDLSGEKGEALLAKERNKLLRSP